MNFAYLSLSCIFNRVVLSSRITTIFAYKDEKATRSAISRVFYITPRVTDSSCFQERYKATSCDKEKLYHY